MTSDPYAKSPNKQLIWAGAAFLVFLAGIVGLGMGTGWFGLAGAGRSGLQKPGEAGPSGLAKTADNTPSLAKPADQAPSLTKEAKRMPKDIYDWLKHLEECERRRGAITNAQIGTAMVKMTYMGLGAGKKALEGLLAGDLDALEDSAPTDEMQKTSEDMRGQWRDLNDFYKSVPPPQECVGAFTSYGEVLGETSSMILEIMDAIGGAKENPDGAISALNGMKGGSRPRIDRPAIETDRQVQEICDRYETRKWFSIASDYGQGSMGQVGGMPNMGAGN